MASASEGWTAAHDAALEEFQRKGTNEMQIQSVLGEIIDDTGAFHKHNDAEFNLLFHASIVNSLPAVKALVELGVDPLRTNKKQINALHLMAKRNQVEMARQCLEAVRADPARAINLVNNYSNIGWTVLIQAANEGKLDFVRWLIESNAKVNMTMGSGWTALHAASMNGHVEVVKLLIKHGADQKATASHRKFSHLPNSSSLVARDVAKNEATRNAFDEATGELIDL